MNLKRFSSKIKKSSKSKTEVLKEISQQSLPLFIYGAGGYGKSINLFLKQKGIHVDGFVINEKFRDKNDLSQEFISFENLDDEYERYNIVIGFSNYKVAEKNIESLNNVQYIYFLDTTLSVEFFNNEYVDDNMEAFFDAYKFLEDDISRKTFIGFINGKLTLRCDDIYDLIHPQQYFIKEIISLSKEEVFIDGGAYIGDTLDEFVTVLDGEYQKIICIEPDWNNYERLVSNIQINQYENVQAINKGLWSKNTVLKFTENEVNGERSILSEDIDKSIEIECTSIDSILEGDNVTFIKLDIEGAELQALKGGYESIKKFKPKLAICMYHKPEDLFTLPQYIKSIRSDYKFYLRQHLHISQELVLYAI